MAAELAIFPLSNVVLFPGVVTPLHLFEPRYRQLARDVLAGQRLLGMVTVPPQHAHEMAGDPPLYPVGCEGRIAQSERLPDGRYNIVVAGTRRFRILEEPPRPSDRLYRVALVEALDDPLPEKARARVAELRGRVVEKLRRLVQRNDAERAQQIRDDLFGDVDAATFVNALCNALSFQPSEKQGLLEAEDVPTRFERLDGLLSFRLAESAGPGRPGSPTLH